MIDSLVVSVPGQPVPEPTRVKGGGYPTILASSGLDGSRVISKPKLSDKKSFI